MRGDNFTSSGDLTPKVLKELSAYLAMLPGVGIKTASKLAYHILLNFPVSEQHALGDLVLSLSKRYTVCSFCNVISDTDPCAVCADMSRNKKRLLIVETSLDVYKIEETKVYDGLFYVIGENATRPSVYKEREKQESVSFIEKDKVKHFVRRVCNLTKGLKKGEQVEIIFGLPINVQTQGILHTIRENLLKRCKDKIKLTRLAVGLSIGADIEFVDPHTLSLAIQERQDLESSHVQSLKTSNDLHKHKINKNDK